MGFTFHCACMLCFPPAVAFSSCVKRYTHQTAQDEPSCMYEASKQQRTREAERTVNIQDILPSTLEASLTAQIKTSKQYQKHKVNHFNYLNSSSLYLKLANGGGGGTVGERSQGHSWSAFSHWWGPSLDHCGLGARAGLWRTMSSVHIAMMTNIF